MPDAEDYSKEPDVMCAGESVSSACLCIHRSGPNRSKRDRLDLVLSYKSVKAVVTEMAHAEHMAFVQQLHNQI